MMSTPPQQHSRRLHTPPAPKLGLEYEWIPFTPRRSNRVAAQISSGVRISQTLSSSHISLPQFALTSTIPPPFGIPPTAISDTPPSSPLSPTHTPVRGLNKRRTIASTSTATTTAISSKNILQNTPSPRAQKKPAQSQLQISIESKTYANSANFGSEAEIDTSRLHPKLTLPTPLKTPKKKEISKNSLNSASRVLFSHPRLANVDDAMPTPKKNRRSKAFSLDPLLHDSAQSEKIEVYEDSKERLPTLDYEEDNPFWVAPGSSSKFISSRLRSSSSRDKPSDTSEKGIAYVFRGRRIFRRYEAEDDDSEDDDDLDDDNLSDVDIRRRAGIDNLPRLPRSSLKPRVLFPKVEAKAEDMDEEALTDIDVPLPLKIKKTRSFRPSIDASLQTIEIQTANSSIAEQVPVPSVRLSPKISQSTTEHLDHQQQSISTPAPVTNKRLPSTKRVKMSSPFDSWGRTKPSSSVSFPAAQPVKSSKRHGSPLEMTPDKTSTKRLRSGTMTSPTSC